MAANRSGGDGRIRTERELAVGYIVNTLASLEHKNNIGRLSADLEAEAATGERYKCGVTPGLVALSNNQNALTASTTKTKTYLDDTGNDGNAVCP